MKAYLPILFFAVFLPVAQGGEPMRPAQPEDLPGIWKQVTVQSHDPGLDLSDPWFSGTQYYWFRDPGDKKQDVRILIQTGEGKPLKDMLPTWKEAPWRVQLTWGENGETSMHFPVQEKSYPIVFTYYTQDFDTSAFPEERLEALKGKLPEKGDVTLTYLTPEGNPHYFRLFRKVEADLPGKE